MSREWEDRTAAHANPPRPRPHIIKMEVQRTARVKGLCPVLDALTHHHPDQSQHSWVSHFERHQDEVQEETETRICLFLSCVRIFSLFPTKFDDHTMRVSPN